MTRATIAGATFATVLVVVVIVVATGYRERNGDAHPAAATITPSTAPGSAESHPAAESHQGFLYGRIVTVDGATYEGRLRWGGRRGSVLGRLLQWRQA